MDEWFDSPLPDWVFDDDGLGLCGCGDPEAVIFWLRDLMRVFKSHKYDDWRYEQLGRLLGDGPASLFVLYELDARGWTDHGSNVIGSWLSERGEQWLRRIEELCEQYEPESASTHSR